MGNAFELFLLDSCNHGDRNTILVLGRSGNNTAIEVVHIDQRLATLIAFGRRIGTAIGGGGNRPTPAELDRFGRDLFAFLFPEKIEIMYRYLLAEAVSLQILTDRTDIREVPWEYMLPPDCKQVPHLHRSIVRVHPACGPVAPLQTRRHDKLKVLFVSADPHNLAGAPPEEVVKVIGRTFKAHLSAVAEMTVVACTTREQLRKAVLDGYDVFHFYGHGDLVDGVGHLMLQNPDTGNADPVSAKDLAGMLEGRGFKLAILSACLTSSGKFSDDFDSVAVALIGAGIQAVVANQYHVPHKTIAPFVASLYGSLINQGDIDRAVAEGRAAMSFALGATVNPDNAKIEWGIPTLHRLAGARMIFQ